MSYDASSVDLCKLVNAMVYSPNKNTCKKTLNGSFDIPVKYIVDAGVIFGLSRNAYDSSICNKCSYCEHCQNDNLTLLPRSCPFEAILSYRAKYTMSHAPLRMAFTEEELRYLSQKNFVIPDEFDSLQESLASIQTRWYALPMRLKDSRIFQFL